MSTHLVAVRENSPVVESLRFAISTAVGCVGTVSRYPIMSRSELEDLINKTQVTHSSTREESAKTIANNQTQLAIKLADLSDITIISSGWANLRTSHKGRHIAPAVMPGDQHVDQQNIQTRGYNISESDHKLEKKHGKSHDYRNVW